MNYFINYFLESGASISEYSRYKKSVLRWLLFYTIITILLVGLTITAFALWHKLIGIILSLITLYIICGIIICWLWFKNM